MYLLMYVMYLRVKANSDSKNCTRM